MQVLITHDEWQITECRRFVTLVPSRRRSFRSCLAMDATDDAKKNAGGSHYENIGGYTVAVGS